MPHDRAGLLTQLEGLCEEWRRWHAAVVLLPRAGGGQGSAVLPPDVQAELEGVRRALLEICSCAYTRLAVRFSHGEGSPAVRPSHGRAPCRRTWVRGDRLGATQKVT